MDSLLQSSVAIARQLCKTYTNVTATNMKELLDEIVTFLNNTDNQTDGLHVLTTVCNELASIHALKLFDDVHIMKHTFFIILGRTFEMLLTKAAFIPLTKQDEQCFYETSNLIVNLCLYRNESLSCFYTRNNNDLSSIYETPIENISYEKLFLTKSFFDKLTRIIANDLAINDYEPYHVKYKVIGHLLYLCTELNNINQSVLLDPVVQCLRSHFYLNAYETIDLRQPIVNPKQWFFIHQCPQFIRLHSYQRHDEISNALCELMLEYSNKIFEQHLPILLEGETIASRVNRTGNIIKNDQGAKVQAIGWHIALLNHFALTPTAKIHFITDVHQPIIDQMISILRTESLVASVYKKYEFFHADVDLISWTITLLYNLTFEEKIFLLLKEKKLGETCAVLHNAENRTIQFASQTLSVILNQENIDEISNPLNMAQNYLFYIENTINEQSLTYHGIKLDGVLANLEVIAQNDRIKKEIADADDGISLLAKCVFDQSLDFETIRCPVLRIIEAISFGNENACKKINNNEKLMQHVKHLSLTNDPTLGPTANRIQWKVEDEKNFILQQTKEKVTQEQGETLVKAFDEKQPTYQQSSVSYHWDLPDSRTSDTFDLMISYHYSDKEICGQIYNRLTASSFYRIFFDKEYGHEMLPNAMAEAMEKSCIILICFSSKYRESYGCRMAAEYAEKRHRTIILVKLDETYCPTGWLNDIVANKPCIEFKESSFSNSYAHLIQQIDHVKMKANVR
ncbi:unnamed protein product [Rotaria sp. Silwood2]|nr:unnamed protein product [Rotaria sp. Silwood2]CAF4045332.1 unnamed protein product [Rotaria sp. Silwood2]